MNKSILKKIHEIGAKRYPNEACGFIISANGKSTLIECKNEAIYPLSEFLINPDEYDRAEDAGEIIGVWHTHTNGNTKPSEADLAGCEASGLTWYLCNVDKTEDGFSYSDLVTFSPNGHRAELIGRPYVFGVFDCWTICVDYYKQEMNLNLSNNFPRIEEFWLKGHSLFENHFEDVGLVEVKDKQFLKGDILFMQTDNSGKINHAAVYIGDEHILHHCVNRLSRRDHYSGYWLKHTVKHLRHTSHVNN